MSLDSGRIGRIKNVNASFIKLVLGSTRELDSKKRAV